MPDSFNPYREWLGLGEDCPQPNYYQLLGLAEGESDPEKISVAGDRAATKIRSFRPGGQAAAWSKLLDEVREAKTCLLEAKSRKEYDRKLRGNPARPASSAKKKESPAPLVSKSDDRFPPGMRPPGSQPAGRPAPSAMPVNPAPAYAFQPAPSAMPPAAEAEVPDLPPGAMALPPGAGYSQPATYGHPAPYFQAPTYGQPASYGAPAYAPAGQMMPDPAPTWGAPQSASAPAAQPYNQPYSPGAYPGDPAATAGYAPMSGYPAAVPMGGMPAAGMPMGAVAQPMSPYSPYGQPSSYGQAAPYGSPYPGAAGPPAPPPPMMPEAHGPYGAISGAPASPLAIDLSGRKKLDFGGGMFPTDAMTPVPVGMPSSAGPMGPMSPMNPLAPMSSMAPMAPALPGGGIPQGGSFHLGSGAGPSQSVAPASAALAARRKQESQRNILLLGAGSVFIVVAAAIVFVAITNSGNDEPTTIAQNNPQPPADETKPPADGSSTPGVKPGPITPAPMPMPEPPVPMPNPPMPAPVPMPEPAPMPAPMPELAKPEPSKPEPPKPEPAPAPPPVPKPSKEQLLELGDALTTAKTALGEQEFDRADTNIARAELLAKLPEHQEMVARLKEVANYCKQFREAIGIAVQNFQVGDEIRVGSSTVLAVVETGADRIVVRVTAMNRIYRFEDLPVGLAQAIVEYRLPKADPVNKVIQGAYLAVEKRKDPDTLARAKSLWEEALASGVDVNHLMPFLSDDYDLAKGM